jgi:hypothetical protein
MIYPILPFVKEKNINTSEHFKETAMTTTIYNIVIGDSVQPPEEDSENTQLKSGPSETAYPNENLYPTEIE